MDWFSALIGFVAGLGFWWWLAIAVWTVGLFPIVAYEQGSIAVLFVVVAGVFLYFVGGVNILWLMWTNPGTTVLYAILYFVAGALWSLWKWRRFASQCREQFDERLSGFVSNYSQRFRDGEWKVRNDEGNWSEIPADAQSAVMSELAQGKVPDLLLATWRNSGHMAHDRSFGPPSPYEHKNRITTWIAFWPWSMFWYFFCDLIRDLVNWIWRRLVRIYTRISEYAFRGVDPRLLRKD